MGIETGADKIQPVRLWKCFITIVASLITFSVPAQQMMDTIAYGRDTSTLVSVQCHVFDADTFCYAKPLHFSFITQVPRTIFFSGHESFSRKSLPVLGAITVSSVILIAFDEDILHGVKQLSGNLGLSPTLRYKNVAGFKMGSKYVPVYQAPRNLNSAFYSMGEGFTSVVISGGMLVYGKIARDNRSLQTASQILQAQFSVGVITQVCKRVAGRESPRVRTEPGGVWRPFVSFEEFSKHTARYDAFPSGHLASMMATVTVITSNYPEKKWIKPVGYSLIGLVGFSMVNNGVHWAGDYPLALGIGYICGKVAVKMNRIVFNRTRRK